MQPIQKYRTNLSSQLNARTSMGPVMFDTDSNNKIEAQAEDKKQILDALHLLYFATNAHKAYYDLPVDPLLNYFENRGNPPTVFSIEKIDSTVFNAFSQLLVMTQNLEKRAEALRIVQAIKCLNESIALIEKGTTNECWHAYLLISKGFEVLFSLNPSFPAPDLRQHMRPILHLKFSQPVELLWKWVDQFYKSAFAALSGDQMEDPLYLENPNVKAPLLLIAEKLLIFSIHATLFEKNLLIGASGTSSTPDDFKYIHPERVLVYFWTAETIEKKIALLNIQQSNALDLAMLHNIKEMHQKLQTKSLVESPKEIFLKEFGL